MVRGMERSLSKCHQSWESGSGGAKRRSSLCIFHSGHGACVAFLQQPLHTRMLIPADPYQGTSISPGNHLGGSELGKPAAPLVCLLLIRGIKVWKWREGASMAYSMDVLINMGIYTFN